MAFRVKFAAALPRRSALVIRQAHQHRRQYSERSSWKFDMLQASCEKQESALRETIEALKVSNEKTEKYLREVIEGKNMVIITQKEKFDQKLQVIEEELLRLRGNFNLRGALGKI